MHLGKNDTEFYIYLRNNYFAEDSISKKTHKLFNILKNLIR